MNDNMKEDVLRVLLSEDEIREKVRELGGKITADYKNSNLMLVTVLKGAVVFLADLMRQIDVPAEIDFMVVSSYGSGVKSSGVVKIVKDLDVPLAGKDILIVEDILDSGLTLSYIKELLDEQQLNGKCGLYAEVTLEPGCSLGFHMHYGESETYYILTGEGEYNDNGTSWRHVKAGDITFTPDGRGHGLANTGNTDLVFMALIIKD